MGYRINARKKLVDVVGDADLDAIMRKVTALGGTGWRVNTRIPLEFVEGVVEKMNAKHHHHPRPIGFRTVSTDDDHGLVTGLPFTPPNTDDE
jgi:hypothetical protein